MKLKRRFGVKQLNQKLKYEMRDKIKEWHNLVVQGLCNGLTHTHRDGRNEDINWVRKRLRLWESFGRCMMDLETEQNYEYSEKELKEIAKEGYSKDEKINLNNHKRKY